MALLRCDVFSDALSLSTSLTVILPQPTQTQIGMTGDAGEDPPPVLYLLHGLSDDDTIWLRRTSIERYVAPLGLAVVMPQVHRSFYTDEAYGGRYWTFVSDELPELVSRFFRVSQQREDTFVAGLSMGGYGALKLALRQPERFAKAATLSGALDLAYIDDWDKRPHMARLIERVFADRPVAGTGDDLLHLLETADPAELPELMLRCGSEDHLVAQNERFVAACAENRVRLDAAFTPGAHEWSYWDREIQTVLEWIRPGSEL
jgi:putative tributyrin esterase